MMLVHQEANILREEDVPSFEPHFHTDPYPINDNKKEETKMMNMFLGENFMSKVNVDKWSHFSLLFAYVWVNFSIRQQSIASPLLH